MRSDLTDNVQAEGAEEQEHQIELQSLYLSLLQDMVKDKAFAFTELFRKCHNDDYEISVPSCDYLGNVGFLEVGSEGEVFNEHVKNIVLKHTRLDVEASTDTEKVPLFTIFYPSYQSMQPEGQVESGSRSFLAENSMFASQGQTGRQSASESWSSDWKTVLQVPVYFSLGMLIALPEELKVTYFLPVAAAAILTIHYAYQHLDDPGRRLAIWSSAVVSYGAGAATGTILQI